jgi:hypothetical protein
MSDDDPVLAGLQRMMARLDTMEKHIDELEALIRRLFNEVDELVHRLFAIERARLGLPPAEAPPKPH